MGLSGRDGAGQGRAGQGRAGGSYLDPLRVCRRVTMRTWPRAKRIRWRCCASPMIRTGRSGTAPHAPVRLLQHSHHARAPVHRRPCGRSGAAYTTLRQAGGTRWSPTSRGSSGVTPAFRRTSADNPDHHPSSAESAVDSPSSDRPQLHRVVPVHQHDAHGDLGRVVVLRHQPDHCGPCTQHRRPERDLLNRQTQRRQFHTRAHFSNGSASPCRSTPRRYRRCPAAGAAPGIRQPLGKS